LRKRSATGCEIDSHGFCECLARNTSLVKLHVPRNPILDEGAVRLRRSLRDVDIEQCDITETGGDALFRAFAKSPASRRISVRNNLAR
jgi:hypothetical protein